METDNKQLVEVLKLESTELNGRIQEVYKSLYAMFGAILPAALTVFALLIKDAEPGESSQVAFMFVAVVSLASLWSSALGMEVLTFLRYRYVSFQPRLYAAVGQQDKQDLGVFSLTGHRLRWIPTLLLNLILFVLVLQVWQRFIPESEPGARWTAFCFLAAAVVGCVLVHVARLKYGREVQARGAGNASLRG